MRPAVGGAAQGPGTGPLPTAGKHTADAAQRQADRSIRGLTSGPANACAAAESLAQIRPQRRSSGR